MGVKKAQTETENAMDKKCHGQKMLISVKQSTMSEFFEFPQR